MHNVKKEKINAQSRNHKSLQNLTPSPDVNL